MNMISRFNIVAAATLAVTCMGFAGHTLVGRMTAPAAPLIPPVEMNVMGQAGRLSERFGSLAECMEAAKAFARHRNPPSRIICTLKDESQSGGAFYSNLLVMSGTLEADGALTWRRVRMVDSTPIGSPKP